MITILNIGNKARISIIGNIRDWQNSADSFMSSLKQIQEANINDVEIYINSFGGSVFEANEIVNIILGFSGNVTFTLGAVCASAATIIVAQVTTQRPGVTISQYSNGQYMIHNVSAQLAGQISEIESGLQLMRNFQKNAVDAYVKQTGIAEDEIIELMNRESWFTAQEALDKKFITAIINDNAQPDNFTYSEIQNCGYKNVPFLINQNLNFMTIEQINKLTGKNFTNETEAFQYFADLQTENNRLKQEKINADKHQKETDIENILHAAVSDKRILPAQKELYRKMLNESFDTAKEVIANLTAVTLISDEIKNNGNSSNQTYRQLAEQNPEKLKQLFENDFDQFNKLFKAEYGYDYKK